MQYIHTYMCLYVYIWMYVSILSVWTSERTSIECVKTSLYICLIVHACSMYAYFMLHTLTDCTASTLHCLFRNKNNIAQSGEKTTNNNNPQKNKTKLKIYPPNISEKYISCLDKKCNKKYHVRKNLRLSQCVCVRVCVFSVSSVIIKYYIWKRIYRKSNKKDQLKNNQQTTVRRHQTARQTTTKRELTHAERCQRIVRIFFCYFKKCFIILAICRSIIFIP